jgi:outer membrane protein TolC
VTRGLLLTAAALTTLLAPCGALAARAAEPPTASMVQEALRGGVPEALPAAGPVRLTLQDAIARGLQHNLAAVLADAGLRGARGARLEALAGVLPSLSAGLSASRQIISLEEFGFPVAPGESPLIGPFEVVRGQLDLTETIGWGAIEHARAGGDRLSAARESQRDVRELVVTAVAGLYLRAVTSGTRVEAARAQLATAQALATRAEDMSRAGTVAGIEVLRANVQLAAQKQRLIQAENDEARHRLSLSRAIGLPLDRELELVDRAPYLGIEALGVDEAVDQALRTRADLKAAEASLRAAEHEGRAAFGEALPSLHLGAELAGVGPRASEAKRVYALVARVSVPLFEGGRAQAQIAQARAALDRQRARVADLRARIEYEVRTARLDLEASAQQVVVAREARDLAERQVQQAEDRFAAGVASNIEVVEAQQALAEATESYLSGSMAHNLSKLALARALGVAEAEAAHFLSGEK